MIEKRICWTAWRKVKYKKGNVVVIRYEGPKGGPGMPVMLTPTSAIMGMYVCVCVCV